jgi:hypothetical protein
MLIKPGGAFTVRHNSSFFQEFQFKGDTGKKVFFPDLAFQKFNIRFSD